MTSLSAEGPSIYEGTPLGETPLHLCVRCDGCRFRNVWRRALITSDLTLGWKADKGVMLPFPSNQGNFCCVPASLRKANFCFHLTIRSPLLRGNSGDDFVSKLKRR